MTDNYVFDFYDLKSKNTPMYYEPQIEWGLEIAHDILKELSDFQTIQLVKEIDLFVIENSTSYPENFNLSDLLHDPSNLHPSRYPIISILHSKNRDINIMDITEIPEITWPKIFAAMIIGQIGFACYDQMRFENDEELLTYENIAEHTGHYLSNIIELITLIRVETGNINNEYKKELEQKTEKRTNHAKKAANKRHEATNSIKNRFVNWYAENENNKVFSSKNHAADIFHRNEMNDFERRTLRDPQTLLKALRVARADS